MWALIFQGKNARVLVKARTPAFYRMFCADTIA